MFGDDKSLLLPIVFDIANLVRSTAKKYIAFDYKLADFGDFSKTKISYERRNFDLNSAELGDEVKDAGVGTLPAASQIKQEMDLGSLEDFMSDEVLDPKEINEELENLKIERPENKQLKHDNAEIELEIEVQNDDTDDDNVDLTDPLNINHELQKDVPTLTLLKLNKTQVQEMLKKDFETTTKPLTAKALKRTRRSSRNSREFVHKLVRSVPLSVNEEDIQRGQVGRTLKLNTTAFASPKETTIRVVSSTTLSPPTTEYITTEAPFIVTPETSLDENYEPYQLVEDMAFASLNGSEVFLQEDDNKDNDLISEAKSEPDDEILPTPEELIAGPRYRIVGNKLAHMRSKIVPGKRKRVQMRSHTKQSTGGNGVPAPRKCERFTASMCIKTEDYPM